MEQSVTKAWEYLRANFKPDSKGRHKTADAMKVAKHFANQVDFLISGPGGIMEMKQTIADKETLIEELLRSNWEKSWPTIRKYETFEDYRDSVLK